MAQYDLNNTADNFKMQVARPFEKKKWNFSKNL